ncbi:MAG: HypC/HybG/HupF family hydrogenase formation chaperone [Candidatus Binatia bacterium]
MCLGIAGQVIEILPQSHDLARVIVFGAERMINVGMVRHEGLAAGEWVLIHVGFAIAKMTEDEAKASMEFLTGMGEAFTDQLPPGWDEEPSGEAIGRSFANPIKKP